MHLWAYHRLRKSIAPALRDCCLINSWRRTKCPTFNGPKTAVTVYCCAIVIDPSTALCLYNGKSLSCFVIYAFDDRGLCRHHHISLEGSNERSGMLMCAGEGYLVMQNVTGCRSMQNFHQIMR